MVGPTRIPNQNKAVVTRMPGYTGDGYNWGGEVLLTIGDRSIPFGNEFDLVEEVAERWNAALSNQKGNSDG